MKHVSDMLRRPVPRRYPWKAWLYLAAQVVAFIICAAAAIATLIFGLAI